MSLDWLPSAHPFGRQKERSILESFRQRDHCYWRFGFFYFSTLACRFTITSECLLIFSSLKIKRRTIKATFPNPPTKRIGGADNNYYLTSPICPRSSSLYRS